MHKSRNFPTRFQGISENFQQINLERTSDKVIVLLLLAFAISLAFGTVYSLLNSAKLSDQIPLFYSRVWGESQLAPKNYIYLPILGTIVIGLVNFSLAFFFKDKGRVFVYFLLATAAMVSILGTITVFNIINLIT